MQKPEEETFIRAYENAVSDDCCDAIISYFEWCLKNNRTWERPEDGIQKSDSSCTLNPGSMRENSTSEAIEYHWGNAGQMLSEFNSAFWDTYYPRYREEFSTLKMYSKHTIFTYKVQKTYPMEGYHSWHCEQDNRNYAQRILTYNLYLNDIYEGGETEFLWQKLRIPARKGTLAIFPTGFTHTHRGNPPLDGIKYLLTGWIELI